MTVSRWLCEHGARTLAIGIVGLALGVAGCGGDEEDEAGAASAGNEIPETSLQMGTSAFPSQVIGQAMQKFVEYADELSNGQVDITLHHSGSLCSEITCIRSVTSHTLDIGTASDSNMGPFTDKLVFVGLPYMWKSQESQDEVFQGEFGDRIRQEIADEDELQILAFLDNGGFRQLWNNVREAKVPADIEGVKLRATGSKVELAMDEAWGATPVAMNWSEVYSALQQGVVEGEVVQPNWVRDYKHAEVLKHATLVNAQIGYQVLTMTTDKWETLDKSVQDVLLEAGRKAQEWVAPRDREDVASALKEIQEIGVDISKPTDAEMEEWVTKARSVWDNFSKQVSQDTITEVLEAQGCRTSGCVPDVDYGLDLSSG